MKVLAVITTHHFMEGKVIQEPAGIIITNILPTSALDIRGLFVAKKIR